MPSDEPVPGTTHHWLARAEGHLAMARQPKPPEGFWEDLAFHAQQAAEFALKAVYQHRSIPFRFTHSVEELGSGLEVAGESIPAAVRNAVVLTRYAVHARYPGAGFPVSRREYESAVQLATAVVAWARDLVRAGNNSERQPRP